MLIRFHYKDGVHPDLVGVRAFDLKNYFVQWNNEDNTLMFCTFNKSHIPVYQFVHLNYVDSIELENELLDDRIISDHSDLPF